MSRYFGKSIIKYILPTALSLSLLATATSCDNIFTSTEDPTENTGYVQVTDEAGNPVTNALGEFITIPVEAESERETEFFEAMNMDELKINFIDGFDMATALEGKYSDYFKVMVYGAYVDQYDSDPELKEYIDKYFAEYCPDRFVEHRDTLVAIDQAVNKSDDKDFTIDIPILGRENIEISLVVKDSDETFVVVERNTKTEQEVILNGVINGKAVFNQPGVFIKRKSEVQLVDSFIQWLGYQEYSKRVLNYFTSLLYVYASRGWDTVHSTDPQTGEAITRVRFSTCLNPNPVYEVYDDPTLLEVWHSCRRTRSTILLEVSTQMVDGQMQIIDFAIISAGYDTVSGQHILLGTKLFDMPLTKNAEYPDVIKAYIAQNSATTGSAE